VTATNSCPRYFGKFGKWGNTYIPILCKTKVVKDNPAYQTKEIINYSYCLLTREKPEFLFYFDRDKSREWVEAEFEERVSGKKLNPGKAWLIRKELWQQFLRKDGKQDYTYAERIGVQLQAIIKELSVNPNSRQCVLSIWNPDIDIYGLGGKQRVPCSIYYQFLYRKGMVHIIYNQRFS